MNRCIPGCTNYPKKCKGQGVSFFSFPKKGLNEETDEWRRKLIVAVARADEYIYISQVNKCVTFKMPWLIRQREHVHQNTVLKSVHALKDDEDYQLHHNDIDLIR